MKKAIALVIAVFSVLSLSLDVNCSFEEFVIKFKKKYANAGAESVARGKFNKCVEYIKEHNAKFEKGEFSFSLGITWFCDRDGPYYATEKPNFDGVLQERSLVDFSLSNVNTTTFPPGNASVDWRNSSCITPVVDEGFFCAACWAFAGIAALEAHWCLKTGQQVILSQQQLIDCDNSSAGCFGGDLNSAFNYIAAYGIQNSSTYPYAELDNPSLDTYSCSSNRSLSVANLTGYWHLPPYNETLIKDVISSNGPVAAALHGYEMNFQYYTGGIYNNASCPTHPLSHMVLIVGYGTENNIDYWLCKNSWSTDWGVEGYFKIKRGVNMCGIETSVYFPQIF